VVIIFHRKTSVAADSIVAAGAIVFAAGAVAAGAELFWSPTPHPALAANTPISTNIFIASLLILLTLSVGAFFKFRRIF
jgi:hypothetical protein